MDSASNTSRTPAALLLFAAVMAIPAGILAPGPAWMAAAAIQVAASLLIARVRIRPFVAICAITATHYILIGPPKPYGRGEPPLDYLLAFTILPLALAAASIGVWYWRELDRE